VLVKQHGVAFQADEQYLDTLRVTGANDTLIAALRERGATALGRLAVTTSAKEASKYVWIPPGTFTMGCSPGDDDCASWEKPSHPVAITKGFWMGQTEVTVGAYKRFVQSTGRQMPSAPRFNDGWRNESMPVVSVSWDDAHDYCTWAGGRLPTEAEWEYAARGGSTHSRYGDLDGVAWFIANSGSHAHEVALKGANGFGLFDVLGNVWEWVNDWYDQNYYQVSSSLDPFGPTSGRERVLRGGSWFETAGFARVSARYAIYPAYRSNEIGFRCAREAANP
jgi:formylglycine-generating enzyme required for sulfatase activity